MTIFGVIWIVILIGSMFLDIKYLFFMTILSSVFQCNNVVVIGNNGIGPQIITSIAFCIRVFILKKHEFKIKISKNFLAIEIACIILLLITFMSLIVNNTLIENILRYLQLVMYVLCTIAMSKISNDIEKNYVHSTIKNITIFLIGVGFLQLLITTGILPRLGIIRTLLYNDTLSEVVYYTRDNYFRILSTYMEPSYYAGFLVGAFYYFLYMDEKKMGNYILLFLILLQIILSFSTTAYIAFGILGILYILKIKNLKLKIFTIIISLIGISVLYFGFYNILDNVIFSKSESGSANARFALDRRNQKLFAENKIIGVGYKNARGSSIVYTVLAEMGITGLISYISLNIIIFKDIFIKNKNNISLQELGLRFALFGVFMCQIIAIPDIDICTYWMWMNLLAVIISRYKKRR